MFVFDDNNNSDGDDNGSGKDVSKYYILVMK